MNLSLLSTFKLRTLNNILALIDYELSELESLKSFSEKRHKMLTIQRLTVACAIVKVESKNDESKSLVDMFN